MHLQTIQRLLVAIIFVVGTGVSGMANSIEEPPFDLLDRIGNVEIRQYYPAVQAVTQLDGSAQTSAGFRRLAGYIFGGNAAGESISMTAPVQETLGTDRPVMAFTMPASYELTELPDPRDSNVELRAIPARTAAVISFSGWATPAKTKRMQKALLRKLAEEGIDVSGAMSLNQYNPPWTLPFLRRNEVIVEVNWQPGANTSAEWALAN
jgi:hypothetical protein